MSDNVFFQYSIVGNVGQEEQRKTEAATPEKPDVTALSNAEIEVLLMQKREKRA